MSNNKKEELNEISSRYQKEISDWYESNGIFVNESIVYEKYLGIIKNLEFDLRQEKKKRIQAEVAFNVLMNKRYDLDLNMEYQDDYLNHLIEQYAKMRTK